MLSALASIAGTLRHADNDVKWKRSIITIVHRTKVSDRALEERGSGSLVLCAGQICIMSNHHVLPDRQRCEECEVVTPGLLCRCGLSWALTA
jgi:hypothetical protein